MHARPSFTKLAVPQTEVSPREVNIRRRNCGSHCIRSPEMSGHAGSRSVFPSTFHYFVSKVGHYFSCTLYVRFPQQHQPTVSRRCHSSALKFVLSASINSLTQLLFFLLLIFLHKGNGGGKVLLPTTHALLICIDWKETPLNKKNSFFYINPWSLKVERGGEALQLHGWNF